MWGSRCTRERLMNQHESVRFLHTACVTIVQLQTRHLSQTDMSAAGHAARRVAQRSVSRSRGTSSVWVERVSQKAGLATLHALDGQEQGDLRSTSSMHMRAHLQQTSKHIERCSHCAGHERRHHRLECPHSLTRDQINSVDFHTVEAVFRLTQSLVCRIKSILGGRIDIAQGCEHNGDLVETKCLEGGSVSCSTALPSLEHLQLRHLQLS
mmetsp:Transcript_2725/g.4958  ORF Transcript_2725/g.4958 Transcript_2725/m.4958 type:complete len:210 (+) Transcript_2725:801-1430(+)